MLEETMIPSTRFATLAALLLGTITPAFAGSVQPVADTSIVMGELGKLTEAGVQPTLAVKTDNSMGKADRLAVICFDLGTDKPTVFVDPTLTLHLAKTEGSATSGTFEIYGVGPDAGELKLDEELYSAAGSKTAVDASGNHLREPIVYDADEATKGVQPVAVATLAEGETKLIFTGETLKKYLDATKGQTTAFIVMAKRPAQRDSSPPPALFHAREADAALRPTLAWE
jgi:hypothetical protein